MFVANSLYISIIRCTCNFLSLTSYQNLSKFHLFQETFAHRHYYYRAINFIDKQPEYLTTTNLRDLCVDSVTMGSLLSSFNLECSIRSILEILLYITLSHSPFQ